MPKKENKKTKKIHNPGMADPTKVRKVLKTLRQKSEEEEAARFAKSLNYPYLDLNIFPIDQESIWVVPETEAKKLNLMAIYRKEKDIKVAAVNPQPKEVKTYLENLEKKEGYKVEVFVVSKTSFEAALGEYKKTRLTEVFDYMRMNLKGRDLEEFEKDLEGVIDLEKRINELPVTEVLNMIFAGAMKLRASDIHFEPEKDEKVRLRYRIDGVLQTVAEFSINIYPTILSRIKILSKMMVNVREVAQDGRFSIKLDEEKGDEIDVRVSVLPGNHGENIVIRLLGQDIEELDLKKAGLTGLSYDWLVAESERKQGMIINSGPTGSGKTTTLYSIINRINSPDKKVISIEDPVEYQVSGVSQTQVEDEKGYTFEKGLRSIVRQDPDIILVGEIRDEATAEIAIHAALTGHLVLTTIHSNSSAGVVGRMIDLGVKPALIASAVNCLIAQRLVRKLCFHCKEKYVPAEETITTLKKMLSLISPKSKVEIPKKVEYLWRPKGCHKCQGLGYRGRTGIFEVMTINDDIRNLIEKIATEDDLRIASLENGMITYEQDGILKSIQGTTSLEELQRVVGTGEYLMKIYEKIVIQSLSRGVMIEKEIMDKTKKLSKDYEKLETKLQKASLSEIIKYVLSAALFMRAGDIHIEPGENDFKVRFRIDGILHDIVRLPMTEFLNVLNEIKNLSGFKTQIRQGVIDGRFRISVPDDMKEIKDKRIDVRVSIILGGFGDIIVMRLLNQAAQATELEKLNLHPLNLEKLKRNIKKPNGIIINTGPTGSGKTTTLYSALTYLNSPESKIITVEDPIEYQLDGIIQTQIKEKEDYTFATAIRALLRQNPDIMMVGEIRDGDTAEAAYQAALTGHLVLSTLHTNSAAGSIQRLVNMGLSLSDMIAGTNCFIAQRLVRKLCPDCRKGRRPTDSEKEEINEALEELSPKTGIKTPPIKKIYDPVGCEKCSDIGYQGRIPIAEMLEINPEMETFLAKNPTTSEIRKEAIEEGMMTMAQDGILRVLLGETSYDEVARIVKEIDSEEKKERLEEGKNNSK